MRIEKVYQTIEHMLLLIGTCLSNNKYLTILRKAMFATMPLTIAGSIALIFQYLPFIDQVVPTAIMTEILNLLSIVSNASLSIIALHMAGAIGYYFTKQEGNEPLFGVIVGISSFLIVTPLAIIDGLESKITGIISLDWLGSKGLFGAMIIGFLVSIIFNRLSKTIMITKLPDSIPPMVLDPFKVLIPIFLTFVFVAVIRYGMSFSIYGNIHNLFYTVLQQPLLKLGTSLPATIVIVFLIQLMWFMGLHGQGIVGSVMGPIWMVATVANLTATNGGEAPTYIFTEHFFTGFIWMQFNSLIIACIISAKSSQLKSVGRLAVGSAVFNISEPIVFGSPVALNVLLVAPWIVTMVIYVLITYLFMKTGICPLPNGANIPWTTPPILSGFLITGSIMGSVVQLVNLAVGTLVYLPFVRAYDKQLLTQENQEEVINDM